MASASTTQVAAAASAKAPGNRLLVIFCFFAIYAIWGSTYLAIRFAIESIPPLFTAGIRHLTAGTILLVLALWKGAKPTWPQVRASAVIGFFFFLVGHGSLHWAERVVPSGLAALLIAIEPIFVFALSSAAARVWRLNGLLLAGILMGLAGVGVLVGETALEGGRDMTLGSVAILVGSVLLVGGHHLLAAVKIVGQPAAAVRAFVAFGLGDVADHADCWQERRRAFLSRRLNRSRGWRWRI